MKLKRKYIITVIEWSDSYGALSGWTELENYNPKELVCISAGVIVYENKKVVALAPNYAPATTYTPRQGNGIMVIPKSCIRGITSFCLEPGLKQKPQRFSLP